MSLVTLTTAATDQGDFPIRISFTDAISGSPITPDTSPKWYLYDLDGNIINSRSSVVASASSTMYFALSGNDLKYSDGEFRIFELKGTYDSTSFGNNITFNIAVKFRITKTK